PIPPPPASRGRSYERRRCASHMSLRDDAARTRSAGCDDRCARPRARAARHHRRRDAGRRPGEPLATERAELIGLTARLRALAAAPGPPPRLAGVPYGPASRNGKLLTAAPTSGRQSVRDVSGRPPRTPGPRDRGRNAAPATRPLGGRASEAAACCTHRSALGP